jgi:hypothetical protein
MPPGGEPRASYRWLVARFATGVALFVLAIAAVALVNLLLLDHASSRNDLVGRLSPKAQLPAAPAGVVRPETEPVERDDHDD